MGECSTVRAEGLPTLSPSLELIVSGAGYSCIRTTLPTPSRPAHQQTSLMVAPFQLGEPLRSFVRIPVKSRVSKAVCWDLSRSSSFVAAAAPIQQSMLQRQPEPVLFRDIGVRSLKPRKERAAILGPVPPPTQHRLPQPPPQQQTKAMPCESKRSRDEEEEQEGGEGTPQPVLKVAKTARPTEAGPSTNTQSQRSMNQEVKWLRKQCQSLRQQNEDLQRRLSLFHGLFRDKHRLTSFVRHLDTRVK